MSTANDIKAGAAYVELYVKNNIADPLARIGLQVQAWGQRIAMFGTRVLGAGLAASGALLSSAASFASSGTQLERASRQTGVAVEALSELRYAAEQNGLTFEDLTNLFKGQGNFLSQIRSGSQEANAMLAALGMNARDLQGLSPEQVFERMADGIARIPDPTRRAELAMKVFGEAGLKALPMLDRGAQGIEAWREQARALGLQVSGSDARAALQLTQAWGQLVAQVKAVVFALGAALAPVLKATSDIITPYVSAIVRWTQENRGLTRTILAVTLGVTAAGVALVGFGYATVVAGVAVTGLGVVFGAILSPIGLVAAAVGGLAYLFRNELVSAFGPAINAVSTWLGHLRQSISNAATFLSAGDIQSAWQVVATEMQNIWDTVTEYLQSTWDGVRDYLEDVWTSWTDFFQNQWDTAVNAVSAVWQAFTTRYAEEIEIAGNIWAGFCDEMQTQFEIAIGGILQSLEVLQGAVRGATAGMSVLFGAGQSGGGNFINGLLRGAGVSGAINEAAGLADDIGQQFQTNQVNSQAARASERQARESAREQDRSSREVGREFDRVVREEMLRMERERQRAEAEWIEALRPETAAIADPRLRNASAGLNQFAAGPMSGSFSSFALQAGLGRPDYQRLAVLAAEENARLQRENNRLLQRVLEFGQ